MPNYNTDGQPATNTRVFTPDVNKYGPGYSQLLANNPYQVATYRQSRWQKFLSAFGIRTDYDRYLDSLALQAKEYDANIGLKAQSEQYDSAAAQAERMRQAGLNPDLQNVDAGSSAAMPDDMNPAAPPGVDDLQSFGSMIMDAVSMASGLAESGFQFSSMFQDIKSKKLDNDNKLLSTLHNALIALTKPSDLDHFPKNGEEVPADNYMPSLTTVFGRRRARLYAQGIQRLSQGLSAQDDEMKTRNSFVSSWKEYFQNTSGGDDAGFSYFSDTMKILNDALSKDLWKNLLSGTKLRGSEIEDAQMYEDKRLNDRLPESQAQNEQAKLGWEVNDTYESQRLKSQQHTLLSSYESIQGKLSAEMDKGNWFAGLVSLAINWLMTRFGGSLVGKL